MDAPNDFYNYILHKLLVRIDLKIRNKQFKDDNERKIYIRLHKFNWERSDVKKAIMTLPYNASKRSMKSHIIASLEELEYKDAQDPEIIWYGKSEKSDLMINDKDLQTIINIIYDIIMNDHDKIKKLVSYLRTIATLFSKMNIPITWTLPSGLKVNQSYLETKSTTITPFSYKNISLNIKYVDKNKYDKNAQVRALMPNLIHSLDGTYLSLLYEQFENSFNKTNDKTQFFSVHDCFGTTCDKVFILKTILASVYTDLY